MRYVAMLCAIALAAIGAAPQTAFAAAYCSNTANNTQPTVDINGNMFTVNRGAGPQKEFLLVLSFFGALRLSVYRRTRIGQRVDDNQAAGLTANA
ncbi:MAG: hypothetical protein IT177_02175 [Acidobacteria bacterium]|nr:hypothetical protein [Acidobacteriota bacterium]